MYTHAFILKKKTRLESRALLKYMYICYAYMQMYICYAYTYVCADM